MRKYRYFRILKDMLKRKLRLKNFISYHKLLKYSDIDVLIFSDCERFVETFDKYSDYLSREYFLEIDEKITSIVLKQWEEFRKTSFMNREEVPCLAFDYEAEKFNHIFYSDQESGIPVFVTKESPLRKVYRHVVNSKSIKSITPKYFPYQEIKRKKVKLLTQDEKYNNT